MLFTDSFKASDASLGIKKHSLAIGLTIGITLTISGATSLIIRQSSFARGHFIPY
jgi:hypothetical protein